MSDVDGLAEHDAVNRDLAEPDSAGVPPAEKAHVSDWLQRIAHAERVHRKAFKQMRECMDLVALGGEKDWVEAGNYVVPVIARHINLAVAQLYAKNPKATVKRRPKMLHTVWDGDPETLVRTQEAAYAVDPATGAVVLRDPVAAQQYDLLVEDIMAADEYTKFADRAAKTLEILWDYVLDEQILGFKKQVKALVRRTKTNGVGYVKMDFQREFEPRPDLDARIQDTTQQIAHAEQLAREAGRGDVQEDSPEVAALRSTLEALRKLMPLTREGLVLSYPKSTRIIIDPGCHDLKTLAGAKWLAECIFLTAREIERIYGVKVYGTAVEAQKAFDYESDESRRKGALRVYEIQDAETGTFLTVCEGHDGYLKRPDIPPVFVERFFTVFPLVFNEVEHETELFPASDVWRARHMQKDYNRSRESRREHRQASRPYYVARSGSLEEQEKQRLMSHAAHEIIEVQGLMDNQSVDQLIQRGPVHNIDPNLYETETINGDILRTVGAQEANMGPTSGATATESSIAEASRTSGVADNVDDLDELLTDLARNGGQVLLAEMSKDIVMDIVGPGAVWPDAPPSRMELARELVLEIEAGSSGRPNKASELANLERGLPYLIQLPGISPKPLARKYGTLLDLDPDELFREGAMSIVAQNNLAGGSAGAGAPTAGGSAPASQGSQGGAPEAAGPQQPEGPQPAFTQPGEAQAA